MRKKLLPFIAASLLLGSCSSIYKSSQTPDDVYYSPAREIKTAANTSNNEYQETTASSDDNYLRMKIKDRYRWSNLDDYDYWYDSRYDFGFNNFSLSPYISVSYNSHMYNSYFANNWYGYNTGYYGSFYNPYYAVINYKNPQVFSGTNSTSVLNAYGNHTYNNSNYIQPNVQPAQNNFGNLLRKVFTPNTTNNNTQNSWNQPARTFAPSNSPGINTGGHSGGFNSSGSSSGGGRVPH